MVGEGQGGLGIGGVPAVVGKKFFLESIPDTVRISVETFGVDGPAEQPREARYLPTEVGAAGGCRNRDWRPPRPVAPVLPVRQVEPVAERPTEDVVPGRPLAVAGDGL